MAAIFTLKNMGALMPAAKSRCWRQKLKVVAIRTQTPPPSKTKSNGAAPAHTQSEVMR
jgi:hypothetical protein